MMESIHTWCGSFGPVIYVFVLIQAVIVARPISSTPTPVQQNGPVGSIASTSAPSSPPPASSAPPSLSSFRLNPRHVPPSLLRTLLLEVMEGRGDDVKAKNRSSLELLSLSSSPDKKSSLSTSSSNELTEKSQSDDNLSTLTLVAVIALVVAVFVVGLFIAVLCPHQILLSHLFGQCPDVTCRRHPHHHRRRRHNHFNDNGSQNNNSMATIMNESISTGSTVSNFNFNDGNSCCCVNNRNTCNSDFSNNIPGNGSNLGEQTSRSNIQPNPTDFRTDSGKYDFAIVRIPSRIDYNNINTLVPSSNHRRNQYETVLPRANINNSNIIDYQTESQSGSSHGNVDNVNAHIPRKIEIPGIGRSSGSRRSSAVFNEGNVLDDQCPYCTHNIAQLEHTWVDNENRQHSAL